MTLDLQILINLFFSFLDFTGFTIISLAIYRIPILLYWKRLLVIQFVFIAVMLVHDYVLLNKDYYAFSIAMTGILLSIVLLRIPFLFSSLIWGTGYLVSTGMQTAIIVVFTSLNIITVEQMMSSQLTRNLLMFLSFLINLTIVYIMERKRLGFMFITNRFRLQKRNLQLKDFFIATFFICAVSLIQFGLVSYFRNDLNHYLFIIFGTMIIISLVGLYITYKFNMQEIDERFNVLRRKKP